MYPSDTPPTLGRMNRVCSWATWASRAGSRAATANATGPASRSRATVAAPRARPGSNSCPPAQPAVALDLEQDQGRAAEEDDVGHPQVGVAAEYAVHGPGDVGAEGRLPHRQGDTGGRTGLEQLDHLGQGDQRAECGRRPAKGFDQHGSSNLPRAFAPRASMDDMTSMSGFGHLQRREVAPGRSKNSGHDLPHTNAAARARMCEPGSTQPIHRPAVHNPERRPLPARRARPRPDTPEARDVRRGTALRTRHPLR